MDDAGSHPVDALLQAGWREHGDLTLDVAERLAASLHLVQTPTHCAPFVRLLTHVYGEHLGLWDRGVELLGALRDSSVAADVAAARSIDVSIATLRYSAGEAAAVDALSAQDRISALAAASSALIARDDLTRAIAAYEQALRSAEDEATPGVLAMRGLAAGGNNLAVALEGKRDRSAAESRAMLVAAEAGLEYWKRVGTWLEEERAEYRLARSQLQAGEAMAATRSAQRCLSVCQGNDAPPFERFFAHAILALARRASGDATAFEAQRRLAAECVEQVAEGERKWFESDLAELAG